MHTEDKARVRAGSLVSCPSQNHKHQLRPAACDRDNQEDGARSYRLCLREHLGAELWRQIGRGGQIDVNAEQ